MSVSAKDHLGPACFQCALRGGLIIHVDPGWLALGAGMDIEAGAILETHGQAGEEFPGFRAQLPPRPGHGDLRIGDHGFASLGDGLVVVADHRDGPVAGFGHDPLHHLIGLRPIADVVTQEDQTIHAERSRVVKAGLERTPVGVDIGHESDAHARSWGLGLCPS